MDQKESQKMTPFDQLLSSQNLQMLKLFIPYMPLNNQRFLGVYVKFAELQHAIHFFQTQQKPIGKQNVNEKSSSILEILQDIRPYLPEQFSETLDNFLNMMNMMDLFRSFQDMQGSDSDDGFNPMDMMKNMLTPEQQGMFEMYNTMFEQEQENQELSENKEDDSHA